jgi:serine/threonine protein kinase
MVKEEHRNALLKEYMTMRSVKHENILTVSGVYFSVRESYVIMRMQMAHRLDLYSYMNSTEGFMKGYLLDIWIKELVSAISHVHTSGYIHGDINYKNVLLTNSLSLKVADFSSADTEDSFRLTRYDPKFIPPELLFRLSQPLPYNYNPRLIDIWGVGAVLFFALNKHLEIAEPLPMSDIDVQEKCLKDSQLPLFSDRKHCSATYARVLRKLLEFNIGQRLPLTEIISQNYFNVQ